jgi:hypothetical protein
MRTASALTAVLAGLALGCSRQPSRHYVERVEVVVPALSDGDALGIRTDRVQSIFLEELKANGHFDFSHEDRATTKVSHPTKLELELAPARESTYEARSGDYIQLEASLLLRRREDDGWSSYELNQRVQEHVSAVSLEERQAAALRALRSALHETVSMADLQLAAIGKSDRQLIKDLNETNPRIRDAAIRVLSDRKNPAVRGALVEKLKGSDVDGVRRAIGGLVALHDVQAVPPLIELARGKDPSFLREILFALGAIGGEEAQAYLFTVSQGHDDPEIRQVAEQALQELQSRIASGDQRGDSSGKKRAQRSIP